MSDACFMYEELLTIFTRAEACLNIRPQTPRSSDPNNLIPLIPSNFLIGNSLAAVPKSNEILFLINRLTKLCWVSQNSQNVWKQWSREYLSQLQERSK